jgi:hypothetical protein
VSTPYADILAKSIAAPFFFEDDKEDPDSLYDRVIANRDDLGNVQPREASDDVTDVVYDMETCAHRIKSACEQYAAAIKTGLVFSMIKGEINPDATKWELNALATLGYNLSCEYSIKGQKLKFDFQRLSFVSEGGMLVPYDPNTGLPVHPLLNKN